MGKTFDSDERSVLRITQAALTAMAAGPTFTIDWTAADNSIVTLDQAAMIRGCRQRSPSMRTLCTPRPRRTKEAIDAADFDTLKTYDITTGGRNEAVPDHLTSSSIPCASGCPVEAGLMSHCRPAPIEFKPRIHAFVW